MEYRRLGKTGLEVSTVGFGCNHIGSPDYGYKDDRKSIEAVHRAVDLGINFFDTADLYGGRRSEEILGQALRGRRSKVVISTKAGLVGNGKKDGRPENLRRAFEQSLIKLKTDFVDIFLLHAPDVDVPIEDSIGAIDELVKEGKARFGGITHATIEEVRKASSFKSFAVVQDCLNIFENSNYKNLIEFCVDKGFAFVGHSPFASGLLARDSFGGYLRFLYGGFRKHRLLELIRLDEVARTANIKLLHLAILWAIKQKGVSSIIVGTSSISQLEEDAHSIRIELDKDIFLKIDDLVSSFSCRFKENLK